MERGRNPHLIVFLVPPARIVSGGVLSIFSLCKESRRFVDVHQADVEMCTYPGTPTYKRNDLFDNDEHIYTFDEIVDLYPTPASLLIHIPADVVSQVYEGLQAHREFLRAIPRLHLNILNQNLELMPTIGVVASLFTLTTRVTQTTAHDRYATQAVCERYGIPTHHLSVYIDKSQYRRVQFGAKDDVIAYSNDRNPAKERVLEEIVQAAPRYRLVEVDKLPYDDYKRLIATARYVITFGEGFDGYFVETVFSGGVPFAVYNDTFFPSKDYLRYPNVYASEEDMRRSIGADILAIDEQAYTRMNEAIYPELDKLYGFDGYLENLERFYLEQYTFTPSREGVVDFFVNAIRDKDALVEEGRPQPSRRRAWRRPRRP